MKTNTMSFSDTHIHVHVQCGVYVNVFPPEEIRPNGMMVSPGEWRVGDGDH